MHTSVCVALTLHPASYLQRGFPDASGAQLHVHVALDEYLPVDALPQLAVAHSLCKD